MAGLNVSERPLRIGSVGVLVRTRDPTSARPGDDQRNGENSSSRARNETRADPRCSGLCRVLRMFHLCSSVRVRQTQLRLHTAKGTRIAIAPGASCPARATSKALSGPMHGA